ncbi:MAG: hypothetical protein U9R27_06380 [Campylobacterota bacterium]|nr:hypothetical protein [Campylobacterota bacterium]
MLIFENSANPIWSILLWTIVISFIVFYPMLISIYVFLPLMIGFMGYVLILGLERVKKSYIFIGIIYLMNLEVNLSLPLFLTIVTVILYYLTIYPHLYILKKCQLCIALLSVVFIDLFYFILLLGYDFIFDESSIVIDQLLIYSFVFDMLMVFLL